MGDGAGGAQAEELETCGGLGGGAEGAVGVEVANDERLLIGADVERSVGSGDGGLEQFVFRGDGFRGGGLAVGVEAGEGDDFVILDFAGFWMEKVGEEGDGVTGGAVEAVEGGQRFASGVVGAIAEDPEAAGGIDGRTVGAGGVAGGAVGTVPFGGLGGESAP
jgi:hypothetical protein